MKKLILLLATLGLLTAMATSAQAGILIKYDLSGIGLGTTAVFDRQVLTTVDATSNYAAGIFPSAGFIDVGDLQIGAFTLGGVAVSDDENLNTSWELTGRWSDLSGILTAITPIADIDILTPGAQPGTLFNFSYTSGAAKLYADTTTDANFGAGIGSDDDTAATFTDGTELASISLLSGTGSLLVPTAGGAPLGSTFTSWDITSVPVGYWLDPLGNDLKSSLESSGWVEVNTKVAANVTFTGIGPGAKIHSRNDGSAEYFVPEPTSLTLLGLGLLGFTAKLRRKRAA